jgi:prevent-host-death family protein
LCFVRSKPVVPVTIVSGAGARAIDMIGLVRQAGHIMITATEFKAKCLSLIDEVQETGGELVISKRGRPVARLVPAGEDKPWLALRGKGGFTGDAFAPAVDEKDIESLR